MRSENWQRIVELCQQIQTETDPKKFTRLIYDLNVLLEARQYELESRAVDPNG